MADLIGQSLGRYHILEQLGEGGMATVYKAFDTRLERHVAIKVILTQKQQTEKFLKRFEREARALAQLTHPNIVGIIDYGEHEGMPYLVMEYVPSGTLKQRLGKPIPYQEAAKMLAPIARALAYAHEQKIIHRDVKPANILITQSGEPMLSDFGIAKILEAEETVDLTGIGVGVGTPEYMSPEQAQGKPVDARSDIYSLGVVLFEMVTGRKPYQADTPMAVVWKLASEPLPRPRQFVGDLPEAVEGVLLKALAKKPEDRYPDMRAFAVVLEGLASAQLKSGKAPRVQKASVPRAPAQSGEKQKSRKWLTVLITILVLGIVFTIGGRLWQLGRQGVGLLGYLATRTFTPSPTFTKLPTITRSSTPTHTITLSRTPTAALFSVNDFTIIKTISVDANTDYGIQTGIVVSNGQTLFFIASGTWCWGGGVECSDANGTIGRPGGSGELPVTLDGQYFGTLIGRVGSWYFPIGMQSKVTMEASGDLYLLMNDRVGAYGDNTRNITVTIGR